MFSGVVELDGKLIRAGAIVRSDANGRRHYDLTNVVRDDVSTGGPVETGGATGKLSSIPGIEAVAGGRGGIVLLDDAFKAETKNHADTLANLQSRLEGYGLARKVAISGRCLHSVSTVQSSGARRSNGPAMKHLPRSPPL